MRVSTIEIFDCVVKNIVCYALRLSSYYQKEIYSLIKEK